MTFMNTEGNTLYTSEEWEALKASHAQTLTEVEARASIHTSTSLRKRALEWFKSEVRGGSMTKEDALGIFNGLADALGWETVDSISTLYTVAVSYKGYEIASFEDIEADDDDSACDMVRNDLSIDEIVVSFDLDYNGNTVTCESNLSSWEFDPSDDFEYEATEQD